ncbi:hypothetical protein RRG08_047274 [Elysia crispata]|uniref:Uncharacterized protein n=1 Tax=Elysia crispata TaxID=231223 RepID=A0AAE0ZDJ0_9GAST|nr:hypothetical protein RRG08_047274 [Elysia crispata]
MVNLRGLQASSANDGHANIIGENLKPDLVIGSTECSLTALPETNCDDTCISFNLCSVQLLEGKPGPRLEGNPRPETLQHTNSLTSCRGGKEAIHNIRFEKIK